VEFWDPIESRGGASTPPLASVCSFALVLLRRHGDLAVPLATTFVSSDANAAPLLHPFSASPPPSFLTL
jgi:hypothetical protein